MLLHFKAYMMILPVTNSHACQIPSSIIHLAQSKKKADRW